MTNLSILTETNSRIELSLIKGILEEAEIPYFALGQIATLVTDIDPFLHKHIAIQVPSDRLEEARELIAQFGAESGG